MKKYAKKQIVAVLIMLMAVLLCLSSCIPSVELNRRAIVQAIGVDRTEQGGYRVTMQIFAADGAGGSTGIDASKQNARLITAEGKTISDAIQEATLQQGKQIFYGHNRLLLIGEEAAKQGIADILPFFNSGYQSRPNVNVMVADKTAEQVLSTNVQQGIVPAESLNSMVENYTENGNVLKTTLIDVIEAVFRESGSVAVPKIEAVMQQSAESGQESGKSGGGEEEMKKADTVVLNGTALFKQEKLIGMLNQPETRGAVWLTDQMTHTLLVFAYQYEEKEKEAASVEIYKSKTKIKAETGSGLPVYTVEIDALGKVNEIALDRHFDFGKGEETAMEHAAAQVIREECEAAFRRTVWEKKTDIFRLQEILMRADKKAWQRLQQDWNDVLSQVKVKFNINVDIDRIGLQANDKEIQ